MKSSLLAFLFSPMLDWSAFAIFVVVAILAGMIYYRPVSEQRRVVLYARLAIGVILFRLAFAGLKTGLQYFAWAQTDLSRYLLPPYQSINVLLRYSWTHFWLNALISIGGALLVFIVLRALQMRQARYFEPGEPELGTLLALVVGWPGFLFFIPATFIFIVCVSIVRGIFLREPYTTFGLPLFLATAITLLFGRFVLSVAGLTRLFI